jgi:hypothetical protein
MLEEQIRINVVRSKLGTQLVGSPKISHVRHIAVLTRSLGPGFEAHSDADALTIITKVQGELAARKSFEELAKRYSDDPDTKDQGGDLGIIVPGFPPRSLFFRSGLVSEKRWD